MIIAATRLQTALGLARAGSGERFVELSPHGSYVELRGFVQRDRTSIQTTARAQHASATVELPQPLFVHGALLADVLRGRLGLVKLSLVDGRLRVANNSGRPDPLGVPSDPIRAVVGHFRPAAAELVPTSYNVADVALGIADGLTPYGHALCALALCALKASHFEIVSSEGWRVARIEGRDVGVEIVESDA